MHVCMYKYLGLFHSIDPYSQNFFFVQLLFYFVGVYMWDVEGRKYLDFFAGFATLNQGHCHPKIVNTMREQVGILHHTARAIGHNTLYEISEKLTDLFGYEKVLLTNTGMELLLYHLTRWKDCVVYVMRLNLPNSRPLTGEITSYRVFISIWKNDVKKISCFQMQFSHNWWCFQLL